MKTYKYIALAALALDFAACTQDDDFAPQQEDFVQIASANIATEVQTRVNTLDDGTTFENDDQILLVNNSRTSKNSGIYTYNGTAWSLADGVVLYASGTSDFTAYYPASVDFTLPNDQSTEASIKSADRMVSTTTGVAKGNAVHLSFERQNAMVTITPSFNTEFGDDATISSLQIADITPYHPTGATDYKAIIAPSATGFTVSLTVGEQTLTASSSTAIEAGKHYTFNLTVGKAAVTVSSVSVESWSEKTIDGGVAEEEDYNYNESTNTYIVRTTDALNTAISNARTSGTTDNPAIIKLTADVEVAGTPDESGTYEPAFLVDKGVIVLDLNGRTITFTDKLFYAIRVKNGATLTINDSSERKQGKIANAKYVLDLRNGKLVINGGTFEGEYAVEGWDENCIIEINGGTFIATKDAVYAQNSFLTITGGTFTGNRYALSLNSSGIFSFTGGSFYGKQYDVGTAGQVRFLSYNQETGTGPTFPGGLSIYTTEYLGFNLNALLAEGAAYYDADGTKIELDDSAASCDGDVTVKKATE